MELRIWPMPSRIRVFRTRLNLSAASGAPRWVALGLAVGPLVAIGLARFAYAAGQH